MRILGLEFGGWSLKGVEMESRFRRVEVLEIHEVKLPLKQIDPTANYRAAYSQLIARLPSHPEKVVASLPPAQTALRFLQVPIKQRKKVEQSFRFELEDSVPFKLEEAIIEHHVTPTKEGSLVFAAIAPKKYIQNYLDWLKSVGVDPDWLTFEGMGVINLYLSSIAGEKAEKPTGPVMLMDVGHVKTNMAIINDGRLELFRSIPWGGMSVTQAISTGLVVTVEEAEQKKLRELRIDEGTREINTEAEELLTSALQAFSTLVTDLSHSLVSYKAQYHRDVSQIIMTGGTAKTRGLDDFLSKNVGIPVTFFRPFKDVSFGKEIDVSQDMRFGEPLGRAFVFSRKSELLFNFRQEELAKTTSLNEIGDFLRDPNIIKLAKYTGVLALILFIGVFFLGYIAQEESSKARTDVRKVFGDTFKGIPAKVQTTLTNDPKELKKYIDNKNRELEQKLKMISKNKGSMIGLLGRISESFPPDVRVDVNTLSIDDAHMKVEGVVYNGDLNAAWENLKKIPSFNNVALERDGQRFTFKGDVVPGK